MITRNTIKQIASLRQQKYRNELKRFVVEGRKMVKELIGSDFKTDSIYATKTFLAEHPSFSMAEIVTDTQMEQMSSLETPPGILAVAHIPEQGGITLSPGIVLTLDGIANPGNMGTLIRAAEWFGIQDVVCSCDCVEPWNPKVVQATMGSLFRVNIWEAELPAFLQKTKNEGRAIYGALLEGENLFQVKGMPDGIIVIGCESHGIRENVLPYVTHPITIPRRGSNPIESLNAAVAGAIIMAELTK